MFVAALILSSAGDVSIVRTYDITPPLPSDPPPPKGEDPMVLRGHTNSVTRVLAQRKSGSSLLSSGLDGGVRIWDLTKQTSTVIQGTQPTQVT